MVEDIGKIISNGFETYTKNLNLGVPFALNVIITSLLAFIILFFLISLTIESFFNAGAIGMAREATETGKTGLTAMVEAGKKNVVNLFLADVLVGLLALAGIVFIVPGALKFDINQLLFPEKNGAPFLLIAGIFLWVLYLLILGLVLAVFRYALVVDNLEPIDGIVTGFNFFKKNKSDVFVLWLILGIIIVAITIIGELMRFSPVMNMIWPLVNVFISVFVVAPLTTVFWVRLYMTRTGKEVYFNDLLAHPNDLAKLKSEQY
ncbi:MAG: hypothetical protein O8C64_02125 [Candidatus Methanoperedens sp.]|nr:hypothetical protein [Candidatus Methanoperedens sp.]